MKTTLLLLAFMPLIVVAQQSRQPRYQQKADSIVAFFLSDEIFQRYVQRSETKSLIQDERIKTNFFEYTFRHPRFSHKTVEIKFMLDSSGQFIANDEMRGLVRIQSVDSGWVSGRQALKICKDQSYRIKKSSLALSWNPINVSFDLFHKTHDFRDVTPGNLVWKVDGEVLFRGDRYSGTFQIDVFTGIVARQFAIPWD